MPRCKEPSPSICALYDTKHAHSFLILVSYFLFPRRSRHSRRRRLALGGNYGSCRVTGNCRPATGKTQQGQADVCHLRRPESGQVRTHGRTRLNFLVVGGFLFLACSHHHLTLTFLVLMYLTRARASEPRSRCRLLIPACSCLGWHQSDPRCSTVCLLIISLTSVFQSAVDLSQQQSASSLSRPSSVSRPCPLHSRTHTSPSHHPSRCEMHSRHCI